MELKTTDDNSHGKIYWVWTHVYSKAVTGRSRQKKEWHAFNSREYAKKWAEEINSLARYQDEVGTGIPPKDVIDNYDYVDHLDEHLGR